MWWWVMIWVLLLLLGGVYLGGRVWGLWGQVKELGAELATAERRLDDVQGQLGLLGDGIDGPEELAVFVDPAVARKQRDHARVAGRHARQQRRSVSRRGPST